MPFVSNAIVTFGNLSHALNDDSGQLKKRKKEKRGKEEEVVVVVEGWLSQVTSPSNKDTFSHWIENMLESLGTSPF